MFVKERFPPKSLLTLDACISRLPNDHPKLNELKKKAASLQKGYNGEKKLDYYLKYLDNNFSILSDVTLSNFKQQFQIDSLVVTATAIYIIEVKSLNGTITFQTGLKQLTQSDGEKLVGMKYPITQVETLSYHLLRWLERQNLSGMPIYYFVAIADRSTIIQVDGDKQHLTEIVSYADDIPVRLIKTNKTFSETRIENHPLKNKVIQTLLKNCEELEIDIIKNAGLHLREVLPGVHCPSCRKLGMVRLRYKWHCPSCNTSSRTAHKKALLDFAMIYGNEITNRQCQTFFGIYRRMTIYNILKNTEGVTWFPNKRKWVLKTELLLR